MVALPSDLLMIYSTLLLLATAIASSQAVVVKRQSSGDNGSCQALFNTCAARVDHSLSNVFAIESCLLGASCFGGQRPVDDFLAALYGSLNGTGTPPASVNLARVPTSVSSWLLSYTSPLKQSPQVFNALGDGSTVTQQNFIDGTSHCLQVECRH